MTTTQQFLPINDIKHDLVFLNDGSATAIIKTSAVNFGLLSEAEQVATIESFAGLLNSLSFAIQIVIKSERLDVSSYLTLLDKAWQTQTNPLLKSLIPRYRTFVERMIRENEVLDKQFYIAVNVSLPELGLANHTVEDKTKKAVIILAPRVDHLFRQLARIGLKSKRLDTEEILRFFYNSYNNPTEGKESADTVVPMDNVQAEVPKIAIPRPVNPVVTTAAPPSLPRIATPVQIQAGPLPPQGRSNAPFIVEELPE